MTNGQLVALFVGNIVTVICAIAGSSGYWNYKQRKLEREYEQEDRDDIDIKKFEEKLERAIKAGIVTLAYVIMPWQERIMDRPERLVGIEEHDTLADLYKAYSSLGGNSTVERRQEYIEHNFQLAPDGDIERMERAALQEKIEKQEMEDILQ